MGSAIIPPQSHPRFIVEQFSDDLQQHIRGYILDLILMFVSRYRD
jgi:hypothetical protein